MIGRLCWALLALSLLVVAGRALLAAEGALRPTPPRAEFTAGGGGDSPVERAAEQDSILAAVSPPARNPFTVPSAPSGPMRPRGAPPAPEEATPRVVLMMEDGGGTILQLEVGGVTSGQMRVGSTFQGWTVQSISAAGVVVVKGGRQLVLSRP